MKISFEFFPQTTKQGKQSLLQVSKELSVVKPEYFSVTSGAGGSTKNATFGTVSALKDNNTIGITPHLSCIGSSKKQITNLLDKYKSLGIKRLIVLRGDIPSGVRDVYDFNYANKLVEFIKNNHNNYFHLSVAAYPEIHPQAKDAKDDIYNFVNKVKAGANNAITQYFYNPDAYFRFCDEVAKLGVTIPIVPGIMPITNYKQLTRFSNNCGADIPKWILERLKLYENNLQDLTLFGIEVVSKLCQTLKSNGVDNFHFYSMNKSWPAIEIVNNINDN